MALLKRRAPDQREYRIVVFYRLVPGRMKLSLPANLEMCEIDGSAVGGIALVRRCAARYALLPFRFGPSDTVLHFIYASRQRRPQSETGALIIRSDTSSRLSSWIGRGWYWRPHQHHARFDICASPDSLRIECDSDDRRMHVAVHARPQQELTPGSLFRSPGQLLRLLRDELCCLALVRPVRPDDKSLCRSQLLPLHVTQLESSLFGDPVRFPKGAASFDSAYWLRDEEVVWDDNGTTARCDIGSCCDIAPA